MPVDPRLNCAAGICCGPPPPLAGELTAETYNNEAHAARVAILIDLGLREEKANVVARTMAEKGLVFLSAQLAAAIREIAFG